MAISNKIGSSGYSPPLYEGANSSRLQSIQQDSIFTSSSYIEKVIFTEDFFYNIEYDYRGYKTIDGKSALNNNISTIIINPQISSYNIEPGEIEDDAPTYDHVVSYNFYDKEIGSNIETLYIKEISSDRTELRLSANTLNELSLVEQSSNFELKRRESDYFVDFYLNFGENELFLASNFKLDIDDINNPSILVKLYEPLPTKFTGENNLWVVTLLSETQTFSITYPPTQIEDNIIDYTPIKGPNFNVELQDIINNSTPEYSYNALINTTLTSSRREINNILSASKELKINVDYTDYTQFINFSSAETRLENFYDKISLIESYSGSIATIQSEVTGSTSGSSQILGSINYYNNQIDQITDNFDGYEYFLYYTSGSYAWPKTNTTKPFELAKINNPSVISWIGSSIEGNPNYGGTLLSASLYDNTNQNYLYKSIPEYLREDNVNQPYFLFVDMVAQHYDNIWLYHKDISQKFNADNRLNYGISKDLVAHAIKDFGIKLYQNNFSKEDLFTAFLGLTPNGALFPFPNITGSLPTPSGYEYVDTLISASNDIIPLDDTNKSLYKRLYHNIPYLLKTKGTIPGLRALITSYGIPDTILKISEFGGKDKNNTNDWDYYYNKFNYKFDTEGTNFVSSSWGLNPTWGATNNKPGALEFRFKAEGILPTNLSQSLWTNGTSELTLEYSGSGLTSGSFSGSIIDPEYQYAHLKFYPSSSDQTTSASVYLPFHNEDWWSVLVNSGSDGFELFSKNKIYNGDTGTTIGFKASSSITSSYDGWEAGSISYFGTSSIYPGLSGSYQEIRYYTNAISESVFDDYVMNPLSSEGNSLNSSPNELAFRASLGSELDTTNNTSIHPKVTGSWEATSSFTSNSNYIFSTTPTYTKNTEYIFLDQPIAGIKNRVSDKVRVEDNVMPSGDVLSPLRRISQQTEASASYTPNTNLLEVAFSPQNEINDDIINQLGYFNIGNYIGDPADRTTSNQSYPDLDNLRNDYFKKYLKNYNVYDFVRLIKYFDNSLFKMIKDFVPARTSLASGVVIKQHLLERNRYKQPAMSFSNETYSGSIKPQWNDYGDGRVYNPSGETGGSVGTLNGLTNNLNVTQSWSESITTPLGTVSQIHNNQDEFYNGELSGSKIVVTTQDLNPGSDEFKNVNPQGFEVNGVRVYSGSEYTFGSFISNYNDPTEGYISIWYQAAGSPSIPPFPSSPS